MGNELLEDIAWNPGENGFVLFFMGILFILSVYHFLLYFQNKNKIYLYYSLYTFLIFFNQLKLDQFGFVSTLVEPIYDTLRSWSLVIVWLYNAVYIVFAITFLELKTCCKRWYNIFYWVLVAVFVAIATVAVLWQLSGNDAYIRYFTAFIIPFYFAMALFGFYPAIFLSKTPARSYIIAGSVALFMASFMAVFIFPTSPTNYRGNQLSITVFFVGVIIENLLFSLGLGYKQKIILQEKNTSQSKLILQLKENEKLRHTIHEQLKKDVASYSEQAEQARVAQLNTIYEKELVELKISSLRSQMNPHFIFNSLNAIKLYIIDSDKEKAVYYLNKFSKLIRKILAATREKEISLADEIETAKLYLEIENIRFNNEIESTFEIDGSLSLDTIKLPSLLLQPFIENAIWHGLSPKKGDKQIHISFEKKNKSYLIITIIDNGIGRQKSAEIKSKKVHRRESVGIKLTEERLMNFCRDYSNECAIRYIDLVDGDKPSGTKVVLTIPLF